MVGARLQNVELFVVRTDFASVAISTPVGRTNLKELRETLPELLTTTGRVNSILAKR
jgi:hypothetical protein